MKLRAVLVGVLAGLVGCGGQVLVEQAGEGGLEAGRRDGGSDGSVDRTVPRDGSEDVNADRGCSPDGVTCSGETAIVCMGGRSNMIPCTGSTPMCARGMGCVPCTPGAATCMGSKALVCEMDGGYQTSYCDPELGLTCVSGMCVGDCASATSSSVGCEFYAITMANDQVPEATFPFYVNVANPGLASASVTITGGGLSAPTVVSVAAGTSQDISLPWVSTLSMSQATTLATGGAYHIKSTLPITTYQFNPRDYAIGGVDSYTNDASLLLPVSALSQSYVVAAWPSWSFGGTDFAGTIAIVATAASTTVTITPPLASAFQAGAGLTAGGGTVTLDAGDVLQIGTALDAKGKTYGTDPTGTAIFASAPVEVFGGSDCTAIPAGAMACDHLEEVQLPQGTLGTDYLVALPNHTTGTPQAYVKIVGTAPGTTLTYDPPTGYVTPPATSLAAGQVTFFQTKQNFHVTSTQAIAVAEYVESGSNFGSGSATGDPAMSMVIPTSRVLSTYAFIAPSTFPQAWATVIAPAGATVTVSDAPANHVVTSGTTIGSSGYYVAYVSLCTNGTAGCTDYHTATSSSPFGLQVYGYGGYTAVMYPAGLDPY